MLHEPKKDKGKNGGSIWRLVYGRAQHKNDLPTINMGLLGGHRFYIKKMDALSNRWECKGFRQICTRNEDLTRHLKEERCTGEKTKTICSGGKFKLVWEGLLWWWHKIWLYCLSMDWGTDHRNRQKNSSQNVWTWRRTHGDGLGFKWLAKKNPYLFWPMDMSLKLTQCINFTDVIGMGIHA